MVSAISVWEMKGKQEDDCVQVGCGRKAASVRNMIPIWGVMLFFVIEQENRIKNEYFPSASLEE